VVNLEGSTGPVRLSKLCASRAYGSKDQIEVHHVRALKDLQRKGQGPRPGWVRLMAARQRKTLVVCHKCHGDIQHGRPQGHHTLKYQDLIGR
jgi:predicted HNH restriction endonuclease